MLTATEVRDILTTAFSTIPLRKGRGLSWHGDFGELNWILQLDKPPQSLRYGLILGLDLVEARGDRPAPSKVNDCPLIIYLETHRGTPALSRKLIDSTLDLGSGLGDDERRGNLEVIGQEVAEYLNARLTVSSIADALEAGELAAAAIMPRASAVLAAKVG